MTATEAKIEKLWGAVQTAIIEAAERCENADDRDAIRDYSPLLGTKLSQLLDTETQQERQHRRTHSSSIHAVSAMRAAMLLLAQNFAEGSKLAKLPSSTRWLTRRRSAVEAELLGYIARQFVPDEFVQEASKLDYAKLSEAK